jgi:hypothetical protein
VDRDPQALAAAQALKAPRVQWLAAEAVTFLVEHFSEALLWDWLIPMVPEHVAFAWLRQGPLQGSHWEVIEVPESVGQGLPYARRGEKGELYLSRAGHLCPDDCWEPDSVCPVSGESRETALFEDLATLKVAGFQVEVIASRQLAEGVGGYPTRRLAALAQKLKSFKGKVLIATACRCHGVMHALRRRPEIRL